MIIDLHKLSPNPFRDFKIDPISQVSVKALIASINQDGFWGGVVIRENEYGEYEIICGHHRIEAAKELGIKKADLHVAHDMSDEAAVRIYGRENATQRGNTSTALAGSIAAGLKLVALQVYSEGGGNHPPLRAENKEKGLDAISQGVGWTQILKQYENVPGINANVVKQQLAILKASGDYARILKSVKDQVDEENKARAAELKKEAEKAAKAGNTRAANAATAKAEQALKKTELLKNVIATNNQDAEIDIRVASVLIVPSVADTFYKLAKENSKYLPVTQQYAYAKQLAKLAETASQQGEVTSRFIREYFVQELVQAKREQNRITKEEEREASLQDWNTRMRFLQKEAAKHARLFTDTIFQISQLDKKRPKSTSVHSTDGLNIAIESIKAGMAALKKIGIA